MVELMYLDKNNEFLYRYAKEFTMVIHVKRNNNTMKVWRLE